LADHVFPPLPVRQWVLSVPKRLRYYLQHEREAIGAVLHILLRVIEARLRHGSGCARGRLGAVSFVQRLGSALNAHVHFRTNKIKLSIDTADPGWGGLMSKTLDRGGGYTGSDFRDHFDAHCGMEVVLANGEVVRTGMGASPNDKTWQLFTYGLGPWVDGMFSQSNFGVVTKMGL
jgi:hypothetical protein